MTLLRYLLQIACSKTNSPQTCFVTFCVVTSGVGVVLGIVVGADVVVVVLDVVSVVVGAGVVVVVVVDVDVVSVIVGIVVGADVVVVDVDVDIGTVTVSSVGGGVVGVSDDIGSSLDSLIIMVC